ncbi:MAG: hypothetical protein HOC23_03700 [Halieaceae bacterium]|nr:hypothetical protein [Halieaceae bacterium]
METRWTKAVDPESTLPAYPRPQMVRKQWLNLNGLWEYAVVPKEQQSVADYQGEILVPFCIESALSGLKRPLQPQERLWYRRKFELPRNWADQRVLLHFGAVDWEASVSINGHHLGVHRGGYLPFSFDVTTHLKALENELVVSVWDPTDTHWQQKGKQVLEPEQVFYTAVSGIWQTVWLEPVPQTHITRLKITPDIDSEQVKLEVFCAGEDSIRVVASVTEDGREVACAEGNVATEMLLEIKEPKLWSPDSPHLYDLNVHLSVDGVNTDEVASYFGMRKFGIAEDATGTPRMTLNNEFLFHNGLLDQGYWPDGLYTAPCDDALKYDIEVSKRLGFNMIRKHIKIEPARWYYHCDRIGIIVWQDMVNGGKISVSIPQMMLGMNGWLRRDDTTQKHYTKAWREDTASRDDFEREWRETIDTLYNTTSVGVWVPFNEAWGQFDANRIGKQVKEHDPTRTVDHASGWIDQGCPDLQSHHIYFRKLMAPKVTNGRVLVLSEYGGYSLKVPGHIWRKDKSFGYRKFKSSEELLNAYTSLIRGQLIPLIPAGYAAAVYTQTTDIETEINGLLTYDRKVVKMSEKAVRQLNDDLIFQGSGQSPQIR